MKGAVLVVVVLVLVPCPEALVVAEVYTALLPLDLVFTLEVFVVLLLLFDFLLLCFASTISIIPIKNISKTRITKIRCIFFNLTFTTKQLKIQTNI